ncbi:MAG: hypothetical protein JXL84_13195 [Deltaproteobacteria bacterium]|nr:hypothetical protein [Deltaproteobacteria bacterium]
MEEEHITRLFLKAAQHSVQKGDDVGRVFALLVKSTLLFRDHILQSTGQTVTVEDVRTSLKWLVPSLATGQLPQTDNKLRLDLLKLWLDELRNLGYPKIHFG